MEIMDVPKLLDGMAIAMVISCILATVSMGVAGLGKKLLVGQASSLYTGSPINQSQTRRLVQ